MSGIILPYSTQNFHADDKVALQRSSMIGCRVFICSVFPRASNTVRKPVRLRLTGHTIWLSRGGGAGGGSVEKKILRTCLYQKTFIHMTTAELKITHVQWAEIKAHYTEEKITMHTNVPRKKIMADLGGPPPFF